MSVAPGQPSDWALPSMLVMQIFCHDDQSRLIEGSKESADGALDLRRNQANRSKLRAPGSERRRW